MALSETQMSAGAVSAPALPSPLELEGSIYRPSLPCPTDTFDGEIGGLRFWHGWCDDGERRPYRLNTVQIGARFYTWFADRVDLAEIAAAITAGRYAVHVNRPLNRIARKFNPERLP